MRVAELNVNPWWSWGLLPVRDAVRTRDSFVWMCGLSAICQQ